MGVPTTYVRDRGQGPYRKWAAITPHDSTNITKIDGRLPDAIVAITTGGTCTVVDSEGTTMQLSLTLDTIYNVGPVRVNATGTAATGIYGLWG